MNYGTNTKKKLVAVSVKKATAYVVAYAALAACVTTNKVKACLVIH
jgi:hypothetical protein